MSFELYDHALKRKLELLFENVKMAPPEKAFKRSNKAGKVKLPLISAYRLSNPPNWENYNQHFAFFGDYAQRNNNEYILTRGLPITITYQIDIWAYERAHADGIYRELVEYMLRFPNLRIDVPTIDRPQDFVMNLTDVETATDYDDTDERNMIHRYTLTYEVPNALMFYEGRHPPYIKEITVDLNGQPTVVAAADDVPKSPEEDHHDPYDEDSDPVNKINPLDLLGKVRENDEID